MPAPLNRDLMHVATAKDLRIDMGPCQISGFSTDEDQAVPLLSLGWEPEQIHITVATEQMPAASLCGSRVGAPPANMGRASPPVKGEPAVDAILIHAHNKRPFAGLAFDFIDEALDLGGKLAPPESDAIDRIGDPRQANGHVVQNRSV